MTYSGIKNDLKYVVIIIIVIIIVIIILINYLISTYLRKIRIDQE
jgi:hypothetical protein